MTWLLYYFLGLLIGAFVSWCFTYSYLKEKYNHILKRKEYYKRLSDLLEEKLVEP